MTIRWLLLLLLIPSACFGAEGTPDFRAVVTELSRQGDQFVAAYLPENGMGTADAVSGLYFDIFEGSGMEAAIGMRDPALKSELESRFGKVIGLASRERAADEVRVAWQELRTHLQQVADAQKPAEDGFWGLLVQSFLILLREGFEAMLVITALVAYLRRQGAVDQVRVVYHGTAWALLASLVTAWLFGVVLQISGAGREALEGVTMLLASAVLFYVSYWLISKSEAARWQAFIHAQINSALSKGSTFALGLAAFLAVYREGAETVLFYQALNGQANGQWWPLLIGFALALGALLLLYRLMQAASFRLPIGLFFTLTAVLLYYLAVTFAGNGVLELQEAGWLGITPIDGFARISWLGLYPTLETLTAQLLLIIPLPLAIAWWWHRRRSAPAGAGS
ncbi:FTR1 family protein [Sedimenticola selenatireducens]|uniref:Iron permease n=1 Tax=Sedimenticola selenatireducens TaxID=191960 RepID=A0A2N6CTZ9_9GAMM|nr:FTR1 family protein [Sedimenticola selenatireducens]PLX60651.1 MAG: iron permease [Sedimenticola selenatireducens]